MRSSSALRLVGGAAAGQVISLLAYPLLTRIFSPGELGALAVYSSILGMVAVVASFRFEQAIPLPRVATTANALLLLSLSIAGGVALVVGCLVLFWPNLLAFAGAPPLVAALLPLGVFLAAGYQALSMFALRHRQYGRLGLTRASQSLAAAVAQIGGGIAGFGVSALVVGHILGQSAGSVSLGLAAVRSAPRPRMSLLRVWAVTKRYQRFASVGVPSAVLNAAGLLLPAILIAAAYDPSVAGYFSLAVLVLSAPVQLVGRSNAQVYYAEASRADARANAHALLSRTTRLLFFMAVAPTIGLVFLAPVLFEVIFGAAWVESGHFTTILAGAYFLGLVSAPASQVFLMLEKQGLSFLLNVFKLVAAIVSFGLLPLLGVATIGAVAAYAMGLAVYYVLVLSLAYRLLRARGAKGL